MSTKIVPCRLLSTTAIEMQSQTALMRRLLCADLSSVRVDLALRRKVVALRAVLMRAKHCQSLPELLRRGHPLLEMNNMQWH